ncbi:MAG: hypothetical protein IT423_18525 [Pirellulaceae bacterium]|nr:hypothetical protein [Pirellulaceae bacterium]
MSNWIYFNLVLSFLVFTLFYAMWCFVRTHLLNLRLRLHYDAFEAAIVAAIRKDPSIHDDVYKEGIVAKVLEQQYDCFQTASRLNAFSVSFFHGYDLNAVVTSHVPVSSLEIVNHALNQLRVEKCQAIEFYIRYCRLSGYLWTLMAWLRGLKIEDLRQDLSEVLEFLLQPEVATHFRKAATRVDLAYFYSKR